MISFENTAIAFQSKTNADLSRSYWLFKAIGNPKIVGVGQKLTQFALSLSLPIKWIIKPTIFKQFCGGETIEECTKAIHNLGKYNIGTILDYSVEGKECAEDFDATTHETIATIEKAKHSKHIPFCVFKVTGISRFELLEKLNDNVELSNNEKEEYTLLKQRIHAICEKAHNNNVPIFIDAEESWIQNAIDKLAIEMMQLFNKEKAIVYNTYQLYRHDRLSFLQKQVTQAHEQKFFIGAKLVRGAYMEKERKRAIEHNYPSPINDSKQATDKLYDETLAYSINNIDVLSICAGSHNEQSSYYLTQLMQQKGINNSDKRVYFSQLLGMSDHISYNLAAAQYNVAKYVPYGPVSEVLPYLIRRAQENTSVEGQTGRELSLIIKEKARRKLK